MQGTTSTTTPPVTTRRSRGEVAFTAAYARRDGDMRTLGPWLLGYLRGMTAGSMSDQDVAETVRGIVEAWQVVSDRIAADLDATIAQMTGQPS